MFEAYNPENLLVSHRLIRMMQKRRQNRQAAALLLVYKLLFLLMLLWFFKLNAGEPMDLVTVLEAGILTALALYIFFPVFLTLLVRQLFGDRRNRMEHALYRADRIHAAYAQWEADYFYADVKEIAVIRGSVYLFFDGDCFLQREDRLTGGSPEAFEAFLSEKCGLPIRRFGSVAAYRKEG